MSRRIEIYFFNVFEAELWITKIKLKIIVISHLYGLVFKNTITHFKQQYLKKQGLTKLKI
ncbi:hypothetical protein FLACHUCJ7_03435 [Flavobacterium chungangense]|uniref:Uncharacterized protein n=1 Tax=Flavobacterium chungangense TaxID=554283 RepID=A0A6V6Z9X8_9FLAO|nr:hypothetical protein FLACHUCJ7_03435 [Flavobacterium chungangense]